MRILGIGIDIEDVDRFRVYKKISAPIFKKLFTEKEITYCSKKNDPYQHLAARFAAKEAVSKAFGNNNILMPINKIEVLKQKNGSVGVGIVNNKYKKYTISLSMSHTKSTAIAFCILVA